MRFGHRWVIAMLALFVLLVPRESEAYFSWIHKLSGPGPFYGLFASCRSSLGDSFDFCGDGVGVGGIQFATASGDAQEWLSLQGGAAWGPRDDESDQTVQWTMIEAVVETSRHWNTLFRRDPGSQLTWFSGGGTAVYVFNGEGFPTFVRPALRVIPLGARFMPNEGSNGFEVGLDLRAFSVGPDDFRLPRSTDFQEGFEWVPSVYFAFIFG